MTDPTFWSGTQAEYDNLTTAEREVQRRIYLVSSGSKLQMHHGTPTGSSTISAESTVISVTDFGAVGDGTTDDSAAFQAAQAEVTAQGGGTIVVPYTEDGYKLGDGTNAAGATTESGIVVTDNTCWKGEGFVKIIVGTKTANGNFGFQISDASNTIIEGFCFDGQAVAQTDSPYVGVSYRDYVENSLIRNCVFRNFANFSIQYATTDTSENSRFDGITVENVVIGGVTGVVGAGSGINLFPRSEDGTRPRSRNFILRNSTIDVSNGVLDVRPPFAGDTRTNTHGPQCFKSNNVDGLIIEGCDFTGGAIACFVLSNGTRNAIVSATGRRSNLGAVVDTDSNSLSTRTQNITIKSWEYELDGATDGNELGAQFGGAMLSVEIQYIRLRDSSLAFQASQVNDEALGDGFGSDMFGYTIGSVDIFSGSVICDPSNRGTVEGIQGGTVRSIRITGEGDGFGVGRIDASDDFSFIGWTFDHITFRNTDNDCLFINGENNTFKDIVCIDGNPDNDANAWIVVDSGVNNVFDRIEARGDANNMDMFYNKNTGEGVHIGSLVGSVSDPSGVRILNQLISSNFSGGGAVVTTPQIELSDPNITDLPFHFCTTKGTIIGAVAIVTEDVNLVDDGSAGANLVKSVRLRRNATNIAIYSPTGASASGNTLSFINTTGVNSIPSSSRNLAKNDILSVSTVGNGSATGKVMFQLTLAN